MGSVKYVLMEVPGVQWSVKGVFPANMGKQQIVDIFKAKIKRELPKRGCEESDLHLVDFNRFSDYLDIETIKLGIAKVDEY